MSVIGSSARTDTGRRRRRNEDALVCEPPLFAIADDMGGAQAGEVASQLAAESVREQGQDGLTAPEQVTELIRAANRRVYAHSSENPAARGMGTTMTVAMVESDSVVIGHVGDSRAYRSRGLELTQLTEDHSLINDYIRMKRVTPEEAENWPHKNVIVRALGMKESVQVDIVTEKPHANDVYLLCSDGLTGMVKDDQIQHILSSERDLDRAVERLITAANEEGGVDNISCILARVEEA